MLREPAKRAVRAVNVALVALAVCLGSGLSPATAAVPGSDQKRQCHRTSSSCQSQRERDHGDDGDKHKRRHKRKHERHHPHPSKSPLPSASITPSPSDQSTDQPADPSLSVPSGPTQIGTQPSGPSTDGGQPGEHTPSVTPSGTLDASATATSSSTASASSTAPSTASTTTGNAVPSEATHPATAAQNSAVALIPQNPTRRTPINTAPTGGGQLPQPASSVKATRSSAASTSTAAVIVSRPALAAPVDPPLSDTMFGINSSVVLAAMVGLLALAVTVLVAGGHRRVRRIH